MSNTVPRTLAERALAVALAVGMLVLISVLGVNELVYALTHATEEALGLVLLLPMVILGYCVFVAVTPRRSPGWPKLLLVAGVLGALLAAGGVLLAAFGAGFRN